MNELQLLEKIEEITPLSEPAEVVNLIGLIKEKQKQLRDLKVKAEDALIAVLETKPGRMVTVGEVRYFVGDKKTTKARSVKAVADKLWQWAMTAEGGDAEKGGARFIAMLLDCLCSDPYKPGETWQQLKDVIEECEEVGDREAMADAQWDEVFEVKVEQEIKEGKPKAVRELRTVNPMFVK